MAQEGSLGISSGLLSVGAAQNIIAQNCVYLGATLIGGTAAGSLAIYDNASAASGTQVDQLNIKAQSAAGDNSVYHNFDGVICTNGIRATLAGTAAKAIIWYQIRS